MSIDEMVKLLLRHAIPDRVFGRTKYDEIIAALKAGQKMRETIELTEYESGHVEGWVRSKYYYIAGKAAQDWDAATKGDV